MAQLIHSNMERADSPQNMPIQYTVIFHGCKNDNLRKKYCDVFSYFCSKYRLRVHVAPVLRSTHNLCFRAKIRKFYTPVNPSFTVIKWGVKGYKLQGGVSTMGQNCYIDSNLTLFVESRK